MNIDYLVGGWSVATDHLPGTIKRCNSTAVVVGNVQRPDVVNCVGP